MRRFSFLLVFLAFSSVSILAQNISEGSLYAAGKTGALGACPLKETKVVADISGFTARVTVRQEFENSFPEAIEAVYTFPLSQNSAVDRMTMHVGERVIGGQIKRREEARKIYEQARTEGKTASLLDQQRPNIFTQSVANIAPGEKIVIEISYVEILKYEDGQYEFVFPMTVGPRYIPKSVSPTEAQMISPPVAETRAGHDISIEVNIDAGVAVEGILSTSHPINVTNLSSNSARISLREEKTIPNRDFILRYDVTGKRIADAVLTHRSEKGGFFSLILQPPDSPAPQDITPKEIVFVLDTSGSMNGFPIEKAKEAMKLSLENLNPQDTFNLITFAGDTSVLFEKPVPATADNLARAQDFLATRRGAGGTEMMKAITAALAPTDSQKHLRVVCFMTDGYVGNEAQIIAEIQKHPNARIFAFGIGNSVNRFLLDKMAEAGGGEVEYVGLKDDGSKAARKFYERVRSPLLTDISIDWNNLPVADVFPEKPGDLFSAKPLVVHGRYTKAANGTIKLKGKVAGQILVREIPVIFPENEPDRDVLASLWARKKIDILMLDLYRNAKDETKKTEIQEQITTLALDFRLLSQFTSFVAVEERVVNQNGQPTRIEVPVELPDGMNRETTVRQVYKDWIKNGVGYIITTPEKAQLGIIGGGIVSGQGNGTGDGRRRVDLKKVYSSPRVDGDSEEIITVDAAETDKPVEKNSSGGAAGEILKRMEAHQLALKSLRAGIVSEEFVAQSGEIQTQEGSLALIPNPKTPSVRIDWAKPSAKSYSILRNDYVLYLPDSKQALTGKITLTPQNALTVFLTLDAAKLKDIYEIKYFGEKGKTAAWQIELTPKTDAGFKSIRLWVDKNGMPLRIRVTRANGDWTSISLSDPQKNTALSMKDFKIELPAETRIIKN